MANLGYRIRCIAESRSQMVTDAAGRGGRACLFSRCGRARAVRNLSRHSTRPTRMSPTSSSGSCRTSCFASSRTSTCRERFPDWDPVTERVQSAGQCIQYIKPDGSIGRSSCVGFNPGERRSAGLVFLPGHVARSPRRADVARPVSYHGKASRNAGRHDGAGRRSGRDLERRFAGCSALPRWSSARSACCNTWRSAGRSGRRRIFWPGSTGWRAATCRAGCRASGSSSFSASARSSTRSRQASTGRRASERRWPPGSSTDRSRSGAIWRGSFTTSLRRP